MQVAVISPEVSGTESAAWGNALEDAFIDGPFPKRLKKINMHLFQPTTLDNAISASVGAELPSRSSAIISHIHSSHLMTIRK
jgi:hypothetical protein